ncbi:MAG: hypothetical protein JKY19_16305 [Alcanivoracaceae bacterium]|nr:hypothetical protein [Alcanivoracaceae bacterium]
MNSVNKTNLTIAVIMGGVSAERAVSLRSGDAVVKALKQQNFNVTAIDELNNY